MHHLGCPGSVVSAHAPQIIHRLLAEIECHLSLGLKEGPKDFSWDSYSNDILLQFPVKLGQLLEEKNKNNRRLVIILDGLDKLEPRDNAHDLVWLPQFFVPGSIRVIVGTSLYAIKEDATPSNAQKLAMSCYETLKKRGYPELELTPLKEGERKSILRLCLKNHGKQLEDDLELTIAGSFQSAFPRFLKTLCDDICVFQKHEDLKARITYDLNAQNIDQLYRIVVERLQKDYHNSSQDIAKLFLGLIWASKRGIHLDKELSPILEQEAGLLEADWIELYVVIDELLSNSSGLLSFSNHEIAKGVELQLFFNSEEKAKFHAMVTQQPGSIYLFIKLFLIHSLVLPCSWPSFTPPPQI